MNDQIRGFFSLGSSPPPRGYLPQNIGDPSLSLPSCDASDNSLIVHILYGEP